MNEMKLHVTSRKMRREKGRGCTELIDMGAPYSTSAVE